MSHPPHVRRLSVCLVSILGAVHWANAQQTPAQSGGSRDPNNPIAGAERCDRATIIPSLPFETTGDTCAFSDDYDAACPLIAVAPDTVYALTPSADMQVDISLRGSDYDTKLFVYAEDCSSEPIACNDDGIYDFTSALTSLDLSAGVKYFIVIDGFGDDCGEYLLSVAEAEPRPECPPDSRFTQEPEIDDWVAAVSDTSFLQYGYANFQNVVGSISQVSWWGINASILDCSNPEPERFNIYFYEDRDGAPNFDALPLPPEFIRIEAQRTETEFTFEGNPLYFYTAQLPTSVALESGWISIVGNDSNGECWFWWAKARNGDGRSLLEDRGVFIDQPFDFAICLGGDYVPVFGACCDIVLETCADDVEIVDCFGPFDRFVPNATCDALDPPCAIESGACCYPDGTCTVLPFLDCMSILGDVDCDGLVSIRDVNPFVRALLTPDIYAAKWPHCDRMNADITQDGLINFADINPFVDAILAGSPQRTWQGPATFCSDCPCVVTCEETAADEAELCGESTNPGCDDIELPIFESIACGDTICGTAWANRVDRDTDWYEIVLASESAMDREIEITVEAEFPVRFGLVDQTDLGQAGCDNVVLDELDPGLTAEGCQPAALSVCLPVDPNNSTYYIYVAPREPQLLVRCPSVYTLSVTCDACTLPTGACCDPKGVCREDLREFECIQDGHVWMGSGSKCDPNPCYVPQPGDDCGDPIDFTIPDQLRYNDLNQSTCGRPNNYEETCLDKYDRGTDIVYRMHVTMASDIEIQIDPHETDYTAIVLDDSCPPDGDCIAISTNDEASPHRIYCRRLLPGDYYIMVDRYWKDFCIESFDLSVNVCVPTAYRCCFADPNTAELTCENRLQVDCLAVDGTWYPDQFCDPNDPCPEIFADTCDLPRVITETPYVSVIDNDFAEADGPRGWCDPFGTTGLMQNDVWWRYTVPQENNCFATLRVTPEDYNMIVQVWKAADCGNIDPGDPNAQVACAISTTAPGNVETLGFNAEAGETYFIQVGDSGTLAGGGVTTLEFDCAVIDGACCFPDGSCSAAMLAEDCLLAGGFFEGEGTECEPNNPCPQPTPGDDCGAPFPISLAFADLPFQDLGNLTCFRGDDYRETCLDPFDLGEDMIYELTLTEPLSVDILLDPHGTTWTGLVLSSTCPPELGSCIAAHTEAAGVPHGIRCVDLAAGTYYLMVDTWAPPSCIPEFDLTIQECSPCSECPGGATLEGEPICEDNYVDDFNGGCNSDPNDAYSPITCGETVCGTSGTYLVEGDPIDPNDPNSAIEIFEYRDTDWYEFVSTGDQIFTWTVLADFETSILIIDANSMICDDFIILEREVGELCETTVATSRCLPAGTYWFLVLPNQLSQLPCGVGYVAMLTCSGCVADPYCAATSSTCEEYISNVKFGADPNAIENASDCGRYEDFTGLAFTIGRDETVPIEVEVTDAFVGDIVNVWVDWDKSTTFDVDPNDPNAPPTLELPFELLDDDGDGVFTGDILAPNDANTDPLGTRMRIRLEFASSFGPCGETLFGEVEDYTIIVTP